jgi:heat shock protein HslJ
VTGAISFRILPFNPYGRELAVVRLDMNNSRLSFALVVVASLAALVTGCSESTSAPTSPSSVGSGSSTLTSEQLSGTWNLISIQPAGQAEQAVPSGARYVLTLSEGRLSTRADCNLCGGAFQLSGQTVTAGPLLACTRAACPTMEFESTYTTLLSGESTVTLSGNSLVLSSGRGVLRFSR